MNLNSMPALGGAAASPLAQRQADTTASQQTANNQTRRATADQAAEMAAGVGKTDSDSETQDRDADGRRLWEEQAAPDQETAAENRPDPGQSRDPHGEAGNRLDLTG